MTPLDYARLAQKQAREVEIRAQRALTRSARKGAKLAADHTRAEGAVDTGDFARGWRGGSRGGGAAVWNDSAHAVFADTGRPPGDPPPLGAIVRWVERRLNLAGPQAFAVARRIQENIAERGLEGARINEWTAEQLKEIIPAELIKEFEKP